MRRALEGGKRGGREGGGEVGFVFWGGAGGDRVGTVSLWFGCAAAW